MKTLLFCSLIITSTFVLGNPKPVLINDSLSIETDLFKPEKQSIKDCVTIENNLPTKSENYFSEIIPVLTLLIGFFLGKIFDNLQKRKGIKTEGREWIETFLQLKDPLDRQIDNISDFLEANPTNVYKIVNPEFQLSLDCNEFKSLNDKSLIPYIQKQYKVEYAKSIKLAGQLKNTVRIIEANSILFDESFKALQDNTGVHFSNFAADFLEFRKYCGNYIDEILHSSDPRPQQKKLAEKIVELSGKYVTPHLSSGTLNLFELSEQFFPQFVHASYDDRKHPEIVAAIGYSTKCDQSIKNLMMERYYLREKQKNIQESYERCLELIVKISDDLKLNINNKK